MILRLLALEVLRKHGINSEERHLIAAEIEEDYNDAVAEMLIELSLKKGKAFRLDPEFLIEPYNYSCPNCGKEKLIENGYCNCCGAKIELDSLPRESTQTTPVDVSSTSAGFIK